MPHSSVVLGFGSGSFRVEGAESVLLEGRDCFGCVGVGVGVEAEVEECLEYFLFLGQSVLDDFRLIDGGVIAVVFFFFKDNLLGLLGFMMKSSFESSVTMSTSTFALGAIG